MATRFEARMLPRFAIRLLCLLPLSILGACISPSYYVDRTLGDVPPGQMHSATNPHPVQLLFEFQTKGALNTRATDFEKAQVTDLVQSSKLFSEVNTVPVTGGALISITINNIPLTDDAASKGFVTGLTFGASGTRVTDGYACTVDYIAAPGAPKLTKTVHHAVITKIGNTDDPPNADKVDSIATAVNTMTRQVVTRALNDLAGDPAFH